MERAPPSQHLPEPGDVLVGKYRVEAILRRGGMGAVFAGHHLVLDQRVAVKVLLASAAKEESTVERFLFEAQASARLASEHVARVMDAGELENGLPFLVMEYLDGCDLAELLTLNGPLPPMELADYALQALAGISHAHAADIIHRDLKPSNLFLALRADGTHAIKILDFGISKSTSADASGKYKSLTGKQVLGSPAYMSPEQVRSARTVDVRSDIWSLGVVMYELLTGVIPFDGDGVGEILAAILDANATPPHDRNPDIPLGLSQAVMRCLRRDREERFVDVAQVAHAIAPFGSRKWDHVVEHVAQTLAHSHNLKLQTPIGAFRVPANALPYGGPDVPTLAPAPPSVPRPSDIAPPDTPPPMSRADLVTTQASSRRKRLARVLAASAMVTLLACAVAIGASWQMRSSSKDAAFGSQVGPGPEALATNAAPPSAAASGRLLPPSTAADDAATSQPTAPPARPTTAPAHRATAAPTPRPAKSDPGTRPAILRSRD